MRAAPAQTGFNTQEALEQIRRSWVSNFSHSLSGPLFTTRGYLRLVLQPGDSSLSDNHRKYLSRALENIDQLMVLVRELNEFPARASADLGPFPFRTALEDALQRVHDQFAVKNVRLVPSLADDPLTTISSERTVVESLTGLLTAALQSTAAGGFVEISAAEENGQIVLRLSAGPAHSSELLPDIAAASKLWRVQGGNLSACMSDGHFLLTAELPVIRTIEC